MFSCTECDYTTPLKSNLKHHTKRHTPLTPNFPPKIAHHDPFPNIIDPPADDNLLQDIENQEIQTTFEQNSKIGFGITQMTSTDATLPYEIQHFLEMNDLGARIKIFAKSVFKIFLEFAIQKPSTDVPEFTLDT